MKFFGQGQEQPAAPQELAIPEFYANSLTVKASPFEFEIQAQLIDSAQKLKGALNIRLSPQTAWALSRALATNVAEYEKQCGKIALPEQVRTSG